MEDVRPGQRPPSLWHHDLCPPSRNHFVITVHYDFCHDVSTAKNSAFEAIALPKGSTRSFADINGPEKGHCLLTGE